MRRANITTKALSSHASMLSTSGSLLYASRHHTLWIFLTSILNPKQDPSFYTYKGMVDPLAQELSGRVDPEYLKLKLLCAFTTTSTVGTWLYGIYFPEKMKNYKDEPWSPFSL